MNKMYPAGAITAQNATIAAVTAWPCTHMSYAPPAMVVLAWRPTTESPISGAVLATISKISASQVDLVGSTFVADTYTYTSAQIGPGPRFHLRDIVYPPGANKLNYSLAMAGSSRFVHETKTKNFDLLWIDSGKTFDNLGAAADIIFTLPNVGWPNWNEVRGARYNFVVLALHNITIRVSPDASGGATSSRIFKAGGYTTSPGTNVSSAVIGNAIEIVLVDGRASSSEEGLVGHRWLVRSETGTWTIAGTPA